MKRGAFWLLLALAGCAAPQAPMQSSPETRPASRSDIRAQVHTDLAANYYLREQYAVSLQELTAALKVDSGYAPAYNMLGLVHGALREDARAEENFRRALERSPQYSEAHNNFGLFLCQRKRMKEARERFESALNNPLYASPEKALSNAGACSLEQGDLDAAEMYYKRATLRAPNHASAQLGLAEVNYRQGRWLAARVMLRQLTEQSEVGAQALWLGVRIERRLGDREAEANYGAQLRRRFPVSMQTQWLITGQYDEMGGLL
ncbi:MAG: type IV pilus biogenesis/stability protein PilW [Pseudomonadota bacterium]|nr:type IV pilus biogenesis/stability protein PilW [Pseudomonadota bacterium]MDP1902993.1 type IV pilus biogenesis/stability protein PilW [Pseudomonadota bacterium]MDP2352235.1 type IV pilus biogenesis/stability protein PilW [Pseudomonadota bacterium]